MYEDFEVHKAIGLETKDRGDNAKHSLSGAVLISPSQGKSRKVVQIRKSLRKAIKKF